MKIVGWRIWYTGGRVFDSKLSNWQELPGDDVLFVMLYLDEFTDSTRYRHARYGCDTYWRLNPGQEIHHMQNEDRTPAEVLAEHPTAQVKTGALVPDAEFEAIVATAFASEEW